MYLRSTPRRNKDGSEVRYLQLAHNVWDPQLRRSKVQVVYNFGREDATNRDALQRLVASITRFLDPAAALAAAAEGLEFTESRPLGGTWALDAVWSQLGIGPVLRKLLKGRRLDDHRRRPDPRLARDQRRCLLPGDGLAAGDQGPAGEEGLRQPRRPAEPRGGPAVLRHGLHVLRDGGSRRARRPGQERQRRDQREHGRRRGRGTRAGRVPHLGEVQGSPR